MQSTVAEASVDHIKCILFDWAGTTIDFGSCAPTEVFKKSFLEHGVTISSKQAREPMGRAKRDHIRRITEMPPVAEQWRAKHGANVTEQDIDSIYDAFMRLQGGSLGDFCKLIEGTAELSSWCAIKGIRVGSTTGYVQSQIDVLLQQAALQGYQPECAIGADDVPAGRPAPFLLFEAAKRLNVYPMNNIVAVDDTPVGIRAGRIAGCWTIGISRTGNEVGLSEAEFNSLSTDKKRLMVTRAEQTLYAAGAHFVVESVALLKPVLFEINRCLANHEFALNVVRIVEI